MPDLTTSWNNVNPNQGWGDRYYNSLDFFKLPNKQATRLRCLSMPSNDPDVNTEMLDIVHHNIPRVSKKGTPYGQGMLCMKAWSTREHDEFCIGCSVEMKQKHRFYVNAILRDFQTSRNVSLSPPPENIPFLVKGDSEKFWTPVRVLDLPPTVAESIQTEGKFNRHVEPGSTTSYPYQCDHPDFGFDLLLTFDKDKSPQNMYDVRKDPSCTQTGGITPLTDEEKLYKLYNLSIAYKNKSSNEDYINLLKDSFDNGHITDEDCNMVYLERLLEKHENDEYTVSSNSPNKSVKSFVPENINGSSVNSSPPDVNDDQVLLDSIPSMRRPQLKNLIVMENLPVNPAEFFNVSELAAHCHNLMLCKSANANSSITATYVRSLTTLEELYVVIRDNNVNMDINEYAGNIPEIQEDIIIEMGLSEDQSVVNQSISPTMVANPTPIVNQSPLPIVDQNSQTVFNPSPQPVVSPPPVSNIVSSPPINTQTSPVLPLSPSDSSDNNHTNPVMSPPPVNLQDAQQIMSQSPMETSEVYTNPNPLPVLDQQPVVIPSPSPVSTHSPAQPPEIKMVYKTSEVDIMVFQELSNLIIALHIPINVGDYNNFDVLRDDVKKHMVEKGHLVDDVAAVVTPIATLCYYMSDFNKMCSTGDFSSLMSIITKEQLGLDYTTYGDVYSLCNDIIGALTFKGVSVLEGDAPIGRIPGPGPVSGIVPDPVPVPISIVQQEIVPVQVDSTINNVYEPPQANIPAALAQVAPAQVAPAQVAPPIVTNTYAPPQVNIPAALAQVAPPIVTNTYTPPQNNMPECFGCFRGLAACVDCGIRGECMSKTTSEDDVPY
jgi:hypothetical protein